MMNLQTYIENRRELAQRYKQMLSSIPQDAEHHGEGNVFNHSKLVRKAIPKAVQELKQLQSGYLKNILGNIDFSLSQTEEQLINLATWLHDIGKISATTIDPKTQKIRALGHQDQQHYLPQIQSLEDITPEETKQLYLNNAALINWLIEHHMDFTSGSGFSKKFVDENFDNGVVKNSLPMKLLLVLMWSDKMGRQPEETIIHSIKANHDNLLKSSDISKKRTYNLSKQSTPFTGEPTQFAQLLKNKPLTFQQRVSAMKGKYPQLADNEIYKLSENVESMKKISAEIPIPQEVFTLDKILKQGDNNVVVYVVGGAVRDYLFNMFRQNNEGFKPKDVDLTTNISEEEILEKLRSPLAQQLKIKVAEKESVDTFGVVFVSINGESFEIAPFRKDIGVADGRRPERVERANVYEDAMRRDLTMNNLYYDFNNKQIIDFNPNGQGIEDIKNGVARPVGNPEERFEEDKLRILRLVRFFARFSTESALKQLDPATIAAIQKFKNLQDFGISGERIYMEFVAGIKQSLNTSSYIKNLAELNLFNAIFPNANVDFHDVPKLAQTKNINVILACLLKNNSNVGTFLNTIKYPKETSDSVQFLIDALKFGSDNAFVMFKRRTKNEEISNSLSRDLMEFSQIVNDPNIANRLKHFASYQMPIPSGEELMARGLKGKEIGDEQRRTGTDHYNNSFKDFLSNTK